MQLRRWLLLVLGARGALGLDSGAEAEADAQLAPEDGADADPDADARPEPDARADAVALEAALPAAPPASVRRTHQTLLSKSALLSRAGANKSTEYSPPIGMCIRQTGRPCKPYNSGSIVDALSQCHNNGHDYTEPAPRYNTLSQTATCSDGSDGFPAGTCICKKGHCSEQNMDCHQGLYEMLPGSFRLTTKLFGASESLYMSADGEVKVGTPPTPDAATWRISRMRSGAKQLFTDAFRDHVLMEYELCTSHVNEAGYVSKKCGNVAGHVKNPEAQETGWRLEIHSALASQNGFEQDHYLQLRAAYSGNLLFISPTIRDAQTCEDTANGCPGDYGAIRFHPEVPQEFYDHPPAADRGLVVLACTWGVAILFVCLVYTLYTSLDQKHTRYDDSCLWACCVPPLKNFGKALGLSGIANKL